MEENFKDRIKYELPDQNQLHNKIMNLLDEYEQNNSFDKREFMCYLTASIYLTYQKLFPQLNMYIPFRTKSDDSFIKNIKKEFSKIAESDQTIEDFDLFPIQKDISGIRIVLDDINRSLPETGDLQVFSDAEENKLNVYDDLEIRNLFDEADDNFNFSEKISDFLKLPIINGERYYQLRIELLERIISITPEEFTKETHQGKTFQALLDDTKAEYESLKEDDAIPTNISNIQKEDLAALITKFRFRIEDKLQFAILRKTLPMVFDDPLIKNALHVSCKFNKELKKENAFQGLYYNLDTPFGPIEVQAHSNKAYEEQLKGSAYHSGMIGKQVQIKSFFELADANDEHDLSDYLNTLDAVSADSLISRAEIPEFKTEEDKEAFMKTTLGEKYQQSELYRAMMKHIKIKSKIELPPTEGFPEGTSINTDEYLLSTAMSLSPYMNICSSGHTSFTTASIHHKKTIGSFAEILRKKDSNTCLREMLIRKLEEVINESLNKDISELSPHMAYLVENIKESMNMSEKLPRDISKKNIINYAENKLEKYIESKNSQETNDNLSEANEYIENEDGLSL